jgi:hypothetical protein
MAEYRISAAPNYRILHRQLKGEHDHCDMKMQTGF